jgi:hypothetical protein
MGCLRCPTADFCLGAQTKRLWSDEGSEIAVLEGHRNFVRGASILTDGRLNSWSGDHP